jgi:2,3-dihydroxy-p-cumate/2,3-dihydroxybenzoate 3,4-dioxygenase
VRLSHVVLHSPNVAAAVAFYSDTLGFRVSDWLGGFMCFLRCDRAHHRLAFLPGPPALNHIAFDMRSVDEMMSGIARLAQKGVKPTWGPGRHTAGDNTFAYFATPSGVGVEYTAELELVDDATWKPTVYEMTPEVTDRWGTGRLFVDGQPHKPPTPDAGLWTPPPV